MEDLTRIYGRSVEDLKSICEISKGQLISKAIFVFLTSSKKRMKKI